MTPPQPPKPTGPPYPPDPFIDRNATEHAELRTLLSRDCNILLELAITAAGTNLHGEPPTALTAHEALRLMGHCLKAFRQANGCEAAPTLYLSLTAHVAPCRGQSP